MKAKIVKHVEYSEIYFQFSNNFNIEDVPDNVIINLLDNIENRIEIIGGSYNSDFVITRRISDNKIMKCMITYDNYYEIEDMLS